MSELEQAKKEMSVEGLDEKKLVEIFVDALESTLEPLDTFCSIAAFGEEYGIAYDAREKVIAALRTAKGESL